MYRLQVAADEAQDEMAPYFNRETAPKVLITTTDRPSQVINENWFVMIVLSISFNVSDI